MACVVSSSLVVCRRLSSFVVVEVARCDGGDISWQVLSHWDWRVRLFGGAGIAKLLGRAA